MKPKSIIMSLSVKDLEKSFQFYKNGLGLENITLDGPILSVELATSTIFFISKPQFKKYTDKASLKALTATSSSIECILSCALDTNEEVDEALENVEKYGGKIVEKGTQETWGYTAYLRDPDGHLWELVAVKQ